MAKSAVLLLVVGFALGLWLGFNPQAHKQVVEDWNHGRAVLANLQAQVTGTTHGATAQANTPEPASSKPGAQPTSVVWRQLSSMLTTLWNSLQHIWLQIRSSLNLKRL